MLHDITACDEIFHAFSYCICRCTVAVFEVCIQVQAGRFYHMKHQGFSTPLPRKRCGESLYLPDRENLPGHPRSDQKANGMHSFLFQMKLCPQKCLILADMNLHEFLLLHQITVLFYWTLGDTHEQLDKKIV